MTAQWYEEALRYADAGPRCEPGKTIRLQPGEYWWAHAPKLRFSPDTYADIVRALGQFESRYLRPTRIEANVATIQALAEVFTPGVEVDRDRPQMTIFGIPFAIADGVPTGVLRIRNMGATRDVALREALSANYAKKG